MATQLTITNIDRQIKMSIENCANRFKTEYLSIVNSHDKNAFLSQCLKTVTCPNLTVTVLKMTRNRGQAELHNTCVQYRLR